MQVQAFARIAIGGLSVAIAVLSICATVRLAAFFMAWVDNLGDASQSVRTLMTIASPALLSFGALFRWRRAKAQGMNGIR